MESNESPISLLPVFKVIDISLFIHGLNMSYSLKKKNKNTRKNQEDSEWEVSNVPLASRKTPSSLPFKNLAYASIRLSVFEDDSVYMKQMIDSAVSKILLKMESQINQEYFS